MHPFPIHHNIKAASADEWTHKTSQSLTCGGVLPWASCTFLDGERNWRNSVPVPPKGRRWNLTQNLFSVPSGNCSYRTKHLSLDQVNYLFYFFNKTTPKKISLFCFSCLDVIFFICYWSLYVSAQPPASLHCWIVHKNASYLMKYILFVRKGASRGI